MDIISKRIQRLLAEAQYRYGDNKKDIMEFLRKTLRKILWTADAQYDTRIKTIYREFGFALMNTIQQLSTIISKGK